MKKIIVIITLFATVLITNAQVVQNTFMKCSFGMKKEVCYNSLVEQGQRVNYDYKYNSLIVNFPSGVWIGGEYFKDAIFYFNISNELSGVGYYITYANLSDAMIRFYDIQENLKKTYNISKSFMTINELGALDSYKYEDNNHKIVELTLSKEDNGFPISLTYTNFFYYSKGTSDKF